MALITKRQYLKSDIFKKTRGFTLVELLVAMIVTTIICSAVLVLSDAVASASRSAQGNARLNAIARSNGVFFSSTVKSCNLILSVNDNRICFWINDDNSDSKINPSELQYFDYDSGTNTLSIFKFSGNKESSDTLDLESFEGNNYMEFLISRYNESKIILGENCFHLKFAPDYAAPHTTLVNLAFDIEIDGKSRHFEFTASKQVQPSAWLTPDGVLKSANDDD